MLIGWLIWLNHLSYSCELIESDHMFLVTWLCWLIYSSYTDSFYTDLNKTFSHFATIELIDLAWVVYKSAFNCHQSQSNFSYISYQDVLWRCQPATANTPYINLLIGLESSTPVVKLSITITMFFYPRRRPCRNFTFQRHLLDNGRTVHWNCLW